MLLFFISIFSLDCNPLLIWVISWGILGCALFGCSTVIWTAGATTGSTAGAGIGCAGVAGATAGSTTGAGTVCAGAAGASGTAESAGAVIWTGVNCVT